MGVEKDEPARDAEETERDPDVQPSAPIARSGAQRTFTGVGDRTLPLGAAGADAGRTTPLEEFTSDRTSVLGTPAEHARGRRHPDDTLKSRGAMAEAGTLPLPEMSSEQARSGSGSSSSQSGGGEFSGVGSLRPFGPYSRVEPLAAQGSMGVVARGFNEGFGRWELIKFLRPDLALDLDLRRQFTREGRVLARLSHPHVVQVFAMYELDGSPCLAMEFLDGQSLGELITQSDASFGFERGHELMLQAARGLAAAHEVGLLHRDMKPDNLFVTAPGKGRMAGLKLIDFGLAAADRTRKDTLREDPTLASGVLGGTPLYLAPELWAGGEPTQQSDLYALGVSFFVALTGRFPSPRTDALGLRDYASSKDPAPKIATLVAELPPRFADVIDALIDKDPARRPPNAETVVARLVEADRGVGSREVPRSGPYRGLEPYTAAEADVFFGRDQEVAEVTERLRSTSGMVLVGPSGAGKSSLAMAGVVPAIERGALGGVLAFRSTHVEPRLHPLRSLAAALAPWSTEEKLAELLAHEPRRLAEVLEIPAGTGLVLIVDQLEELTTVAKSPAEVECFAEALASLVATTSPQLRIVATLRADLMDRLFSFEPLRHWLTKGFYPVRPLLGDALLKALEEPAKMAGYRLEDEGITRQIAADVTHTRAGLPLASFAMQRWWQSRDERRFLLPAEAWQRIGGLAGALVQHADNVIDAMSPEERQATDRMLPRLVNSEHTRNLVAASELTDPSVAGAHGQRALARLVDSKLTLETAGQIELVHDALISHWPRLRGLLTADEEDRRFHERVARAAREWESADRADGALWDGAQAMRLGEWFAGSAAALNQIELEFVARVRQRAKRARWLNRGLGAAAILVVGTLLLITTTRHRRSETRLAAVQTELEQLGKRNTHALAVLEREVAEHLLDNDPTLALARAYRSRELEPDPGLEGIALRARVRGVYRALPRHEGGAADVGFVSGNLVSIGGAEAHFLDLEKNEAHAISAQGGEFGAPPTAFVTTAGEAYLGDLNGRVWRLASPWKEAELVAECQLPVRELAIAAGKVFGLCRNREQAHRLVEYDTKTRKARRVSTGRYTALAMGPAAGAALAAGAEGVLELGALDGSSPTQVGVSKDITALCALTPGRWLAGSQRGELTTITIDQNAASLAPWSRTASTTPIRTLFAAPDRESFLAFDDQGFALLFGPNLEPRARQRVSGHAHVWLARRGAVALAGPDHAVLVLDSARGQVLGRLLGATDAVTGLAANDDWLVSTSLDGGVRAYPLNVSVPEVAKVPGASPARCVLSPAGTRWACATEHDVELSEAGKPAAFETLDPKLPPGTPIADALVAIDDTGRIALRRSVRSLELKKGDVAHIVDVAGEIHRVWPRPNAGFAISHGRDSGYGLLVVDDSPQHTERYQLRAAARALAQTPGGELVVVSEDGNWYDLVDGRVSPRKAPDQGSAASALAIAPESADIAFGTERGGLFVESRGQFSELAQLGSRITCIAWARSERALIATTQSGESYAVHLDTKGRTKLFAPNDGISACAYDSLGRVFTWLAPGGLAWRQALDTTPLALSARPIDATSARDTKLDGFNGLFLQDGS